MRYVAQRFQLIQLGICFFESIPSATGKAAFNAYPYNIYLCPEESPGMPNYMVLDVDTTAFLREQKFDFNKWIYEGVPFLNDRAEKGLMGRAGEERKDEKEDLQLTEEETKKTGLILENIKKWIDEGAENEYVAPELNSYLRKYMYQVVEELYPTLYVKSRSKGKFDKDIVLKKMTHEEKKEIKDSKKKDEIREIQRKSGAKRLFQAMTSKKIPVVGHTPLFDLLFLYSHFEGELPLSLDKFKANILNLFPT
jgi:poly(A)-specific ribonuclease